jgi:hypothetical protein
MTNDEKRLAVFAVGAIGGSVIGYHAFQHLFVQGITDEERSAFLKAGLTGLSIWVVKNFVDLSPLRPYQQWIDPAGVLFPGT